MDYGRCQCGVKSHVKHTRMIRRYLRVFTEIVEDSVRFHILEILHLRETSPSLAQCGTHQKYRVHTLTANTAGRASACFWNRSTGYTAPTPQFHHGMNRGKRLQTSDRSSDSPSKGSVCYVTDFSGGVDNLCTVQRRRGG